MKLAVFLSLYSISVAIAAPLLHRYVPPENRDDDHWFEIILASLVWPGILLQLYIENKRREKEEK